ncbi:MAG TPA: serine hydrolase [Anaerolineales bacterium]|nr:serine hydrolase [Anaerolineales bacterium]
MTNTSTLKRTTPEAEGISSSAILDFIHAVEQHTHPLDALHGFMLLRHGNVVAEGWWPPYNPQASHSLYSLSKSFTSSAIGLAVAEGLLTVDDPVLKFFPDDAPAHPSENLKAMCVRHLLSMNTGHYEDTTQYVFQRHHPFNLFGLESHHKTTPRKLTLEHEEANWPRVFLSLPVERAPGTWFVYNTAATYMLSAIITQLTGETLVDYLRPRLFAPLGIENPVWDTDPRGISLGGTGLHLPTEAIARFGQMYLQKGMWNGQRILPEAWIEEATKATSDNSNIQSSPDWMVGYGYQFWRCKHHCYRGDGAFGQYCVVMPEQDAVLAINSGLRDMQAVLDKVWEHLLPAMHPGPLPVIPHAQDALQEKLVSLSLPLPAGKPSSVWAEKSSGKTYILEPNEFQVNRVALKFEGEQNKLIVQDGRGEFTIQIGQGIWYESSNHLRGYGAEPIASSGAWTAENTYEIRICYAESEFSLIFRFHYLGDELHLEVEPNVSWVSPHTRTLKGKLEK